MHTKHTLVVTASLVSLASLGVALAFPPGPPMRPGPPPRPMGGPSFGGGGFARPAPAMSAPRPSFYAPREFAPSYRPQAPVSRPPPSAFNHASGGLMPSAGGSFAQRQLAAMRSQNSTPSLPRTWPAAGPQGAAAARPMGGARQPLTGQRGDFLGMSRATQRPGQGLAARPIQPRAGERLGQAGRRGDFAKGANRLINTRPSWANISADRLAGIANRWSTAIHKPGASWGRPIGTRWDHWADRVRDHWQAYRRDYSNGWFDRDWWDHHEYGTYGWQYAYCSSYDSYPNGYWWSSPTWYGTTNWSDDSSGYTGSQPVYYDYASGGNVTYQDNRVYIYGEQVASADEFAESAAALATVAPPASEEEVEKAEWMPLGTFAVSASEKDTRPSRVVQLALNKQGVIAGTLYNTQTDQALTIQGKVDKTTQRVAFRLGENENVVCETGLYNLTQDSVPVLVHFGKDNVESYLLVRIPAPKDAPSATQSEIQLRASGE